MSPKKDIVYGSALTRTELEALLPKNEPIPFVYIYSCAVKLNYNQDELFQKINEIKVEIPDFTKVINNNSGSEYDCLIIEFSKRQWSIDFNWKENEVWVQLSFREKGKPWGSNYALWLLHQKWIFQHLDATLIRPLMDHVNPVSLKHPKK